MEGASQCMNVDHVDKNWNDESESVAIDSVISLRSEDKSSVVDDHNFKVKDNEESSYSDSFLSTQKVRELMNNIFDTPSGPTCVQDVGVSDSMDVDQPSLINNVLVDVQVDSVFKDGDETDVKTLVVPFQHEKKLNKACLSPYVVSPPTTEVKCKKSRRNNNKKKIKKVIKSVFGPNGKEIPLLPWKEDLTRSPNAPKNRATVKEVGYRMMHANDVWATASRYLSDMLLRCEFPVCYLSDMLLLGFETNMGVSYSSLSGGGRDEWENFARDNLNSSVRTLHFVKEADDTFYVTGYNYDGIEYQGYEQRVVGNRVVTCLILPGDFLRGIWKNKFKVYINRSRYKLRHERVQTNPNRVERSNRLVGENWDKLVADIRIAECHVMVFTNMGHNRLQLALFHNNGTCMHDSIVLPTMLRLPARTIASYAVDGHVGHYKEDDVFYIILNAPVYDNHRLCQLNTESITGWTHTGKNCSFMMMSGRAKWRLVKSDPSRPPKEEVEATIMMKVQVQSLIHQASFLGQGSQFRVVVNLWANMRSRSSSARGTTNDLDQAIDWLLGRSLRSQAPLVLQQHDIWVKLLVQGRSLVKPLMQGRPQVNPVQHKAQQNKDQASVLQGTNRWVPASGFNSYAEAEYRGVANAVPETAWLRNLLRELHTPLVTATLVYCDNVSVVYLSANPIQHQRTKHIEIDIHFVRDMVTTGLVCVLHVPSRYQYADIFTKGLPSALFEEFDTSLSVRSPPT
ncbi:ribonuclease H-like domain-containing protein [Tanacetum coccineum]